MFGKDKAAAHNVESVMLATANYLRLKSVEIVAVPDQKRIELQHFGRLDEHITFTGHYKRKSL